MEDANLIVRVEIEPKRQRVQRGDQAWPLEFSRYIHSNELYSNSVNQLIIDT